MASAATSGAGGDRDGFVGREQELAELCRLAAGSRLVTLCGAGGTGKTRLLHALVTALAPGYPDGTFVSRLAGLAQPDLLAPQVAATLGVSEEPTAELADTLAEALRDRRLILALDGYEQLTGACAGLCERLLDSSPGLLLVAAGREPLRVPGEAVWAVPALTLPAAGEKDPARAGQADAVRLFTSRAAAAIPGFALDRENCAAVVAACRAAGGVPLAIELAAARAGSTSPARIAAGLSAWPSPPGPADRAAPAAAQPPHDAAVTAAIGWSHDQLAPAEQVMLRRLSASPGWTLEMVEQVCADGQLPAIGSLGLLQSLAAVGMVRGDGRQGRWRLPRAVSDDAAARLAKAGETETTGRRLRDYTAQRVAYLVSILYARVPVTGPVISKLFRDYDTDARNVRAALTWCLDHGDVREGLRICTGFGICWIAAGAPGEAARWFGALSAFLDSAEPALRGPALAIRGQVAFHRGDLRGTRAWASAGLALCRAARDLFHAAIALNVLGQEAIAAGHPRDALRFTGEALELARSSWDSWNRGFALNVRAEALIAMGRPAEAREYAASALSLALETSHHYSAAIARRRLGDAALATGDLAGATEYYLAVLPYMRRIMPRSETARCLASLGRIALRQGDTGAAREYLADSLRTGLGAGSRAAIADTLLGFAELATASGRPDRAAQLAAAATAQCAAVGLPPPPQAQQYRDAAAGLPRAGQLWADGLGLASRPAARLALAQD